MVRATVEFWAGIQTIGCVPGKLAVLVGLRAAAVFGVRVARALFGFSMARNERRAAAGSACWRSHGSLFYFVSTNIHLFLQVVQLKNIFVAL